MSNDRLVKVAFATKDKTRINAGFEQAHCIVVYEIGVADARQCTTMTYHAAPSNAVGSPESHLRNGKGNPGCGGSKKKEDAIDENEILAKAASLAGISVLFVDKALHAFSAFILNEARIFTVKVDDQRERLLIRSCTFRKCCVASRHSGCVVL